MQTKGIYPRKIIKKEAMRERIEFEQDGKIYAVSIIKLSVNELIPSFKREIKVSVREKGSRLGGIIEHQHTRYSWPSILNFAAKLWFKNLKRRIR